MPPRRYRSCLTLVPILSVNTGLFVHRCSGSGNGLGNDRKDRGSWPQRAGNSQDMSRKLPLSRQSPPVPPKADATSPGLLWRIPETRQGTKSRRWQEISPPASVFSHLRSVPEPTRCDGAPGTDVSGSKALWLSGDGSHYRFLRSRCSLRYQAPA